MKLKRQIRGTTAEMDLLILPEGVITVDTDRDEIRLHDGITPGGKRFLNESQLITYKSIRFSAVVTVGLIADAALDSTSPGKLHNISSTGGPWILSLPLLADLDVGQPILLRAASADVQIANLDGQTVMFDSVEYGPAAAAFLYTIPLGQIIEICKYSPTNWLVTNIRG